MTSKEEQNITRNLRNLIKHFLAQDILNRFSSSLDEFKSLDKAVISQLSEIMNVRIQNIHKHFNGEQKYDVVDFLRYWRAYSKLWDKYYDLDEASHEDVSSKKKLTIEEFIASYSSYFEILDMSYIEEPDVLVTSYPETFIQFLKFLEAVKKNDQQKKNPILKPCHIAVIDYFKEIPLLKYELDKQTKLKYQKRLERMED